MSQSEFQEKPETEVLPNESSESQVEQHAGTKTELPAQENAAPPSTETVPPAEESSIETEPLPVEASSSSPSGFQNVLYTLFSPETRVGRFMRPALRWAALVVGLFAIGFLTAYLLLYRPTQELLNNATSNLQSLNQQMDEQKTKMQSVESNLQQALNQSQQDRAALELAQSRYQLLSTLHQVEIARLALTNRDGPTAQKALIQARAQIDLLLPFVKTHDAELASSLDARLSLIANEINRDPQTAQADLEILSKALELLDQVYAKK